MYAIQYVEKAKDLNEAEIMLFGCSKLEGYIGGRILEPSDQIYKNTWRIQVFFKYEEDTILPDNCRKVFLPDSQKRMFNII